MGWVVRVHTRKTAYATAGVGRGRQDAQASLIVDFGFNT